MDFYFQVMDKYLFNVTFYVFLLLFQISISFFLNLIIYLKKLMTSAIIANIKPAITPKLIFYLLYNDRYYLFKDVDMMFTINLKLNMIY